MDSARGRGIGRGTAGGCAEALQGGVQRHCRRVCRGTAGGCAEALQGVVCIRYCRVMGTGTSRGHAWGLVSWLTRTACAAGCI